jgi:hypothetical protein
LPAVPEFVPQFFSFMFWNFAAKSFVLPLQGAGAFLYVPLVFYFIFGLGLFLTLKRGVAGGRDSIAVCGLLAAAIWPFVLMAIFYSQTFRDVFSGVSAAATGRIRHLWNIWPFFVTLATFVFAGKLDSRGGSAIRVTVWVLLSALAAAAIEYGLYFLLDEQISDPLYLISHANSSGLRSANAISLATLTDPWILLPFVNLFIVGTLAVVLNKGCWGLVGRHIYSPLAIVLCVISAFLFISIQNDLRLYQGGWLLSAANDYRYRTYLERNACINAAISRGDPNYRTLVSGAPQFGETGRNWKLIAETELNTAERHKTLYSWREIIDPYTTATLGLFTGKFNRRVEWSPTTDQVLKNFDTLGLIGVRWLISADQSVDDPRLTFRAECSSPPGPLMASGKEKEGGSLYVYELRDATPIAWLARRAEVATIASAARRIFVDREKPWVKGLALVDHLPSDYKNTVAPVAVGTARITRQTPLTMEIKTQSDESRLLVVSYTKRNNWLAYVDGKPVPVNDVYGGLIGVSIPAGQHDVTFVYRSVWLRWGAIGSLAAMLAPFLVWMIARRLKSRNGRGRRVAVQE